MKCELIIFTYAIAILQTLQILVWKISIKEWFSVGCQGVVLICLVINLILGLLRRRDRND